jgi:hypothetical protein
MTDEQKAVILNANKERIKEAIQNVIPYGQKIPAGMMENLPQMLGDILDVLHDACLLDYPHKAKDINAAYNWVKSDVNSILPYIYSEEEEN